MKRWIALGLFLGGSFILGSGALFATSQSQLDSDIETKLPTGRVPPIAAADLRGILHEMTAQTYSGQFSNGIHTGTAATSTPPNHWTNSYMPGVDVANRILNYNISTNGYMTSFAGVRSSDNTAITSQNILADTCLSVADNTSVAHENWCRYEQSNIPSGSVFREVIGDENTIANNTGSNSGVTDPYTPNPLSNAINLRLDSGTGAAANDVSAAIDILNNGGQYIAGIVFGSTALDTGLSSTPPAIALPQNYALSWYSAASTIQWNFFGGAADLNATAVGSGNFNITNGNNQQLKLINSGTLANPAQLGSDANGLLRINGSQGVGLYTGGNPGTSRFNIANDGRISLFSPLADASVNVQTSGSSLAIGANLDRIILDGVNSTYTLTMPASPVDGQRLILECGTSVTSLTTSPAAGQTMKGTASSCSATQGHLWHYRSANTAWYMSY